MILLYRLDPVTEVRYACIMDYFVKLLHVIERLLYLCLIDLPALYVLTQTCSVISSLLISGEYLRKSAYSIYRIRRYLPSAVKKFIKKELTSLLQWYLFAAFAALTITLLITLFCIYQFCCLVICRWFVVLP